MRDDRFIETQPVTGDEASYTRPQRRRDQEALAQEESGVPVEWNVGNVILDLYEVTDFLGQGATGKVYRVHHREWNLDLAVKTPKPEVISSVGGVENFERECQTWVDLGLHPYTVSCYYVRRLGGIPRVFVEFGEGGTLKDWIADKRLYDGGPDRALPRMLDIAIRFAWGLHYAHENGLVHQDVKPGNVVMTPEGTPKVSDFGTALARVMVYSDDSQAENEEVEVSYAGMTPPYCSPEQKRAWEGIAEEHRTKLTLQTDIWSWGVSILEMFTGGLRWSWGIAAPEALEEYLSKEPEDEAIPRMPEGLADLLRHCFQQNPQERPKDMLEVVTVLQEIYEHEIGLAYPRESPETVELLAAALDNRAVSLFDLGREEEATDALEEALKVDPAHPEAVFNDAVLRWRNLEITDLDVVRRLEVMIQSHPGEWHPHYLLGLIHMCRRDAEGAENALGEALTLAPDEKQCTASLEYVRKNKYQWPHCSRVLEAHGHKKGMMTVAITPDGRFALSGSKDNNLRLWDLSNGECLRTWEGHTDRVNSIAITPDGHFALSGSSDEVIFLWDLVTGECLRTFAGHNSIVKSVAITPDGCFALSGSSDKTLRLWDLITGACLRTFGGHTSIVKSVAITPNGRFALSGSDDHTMRLWDLPSGACLRTFEGHSNIVNSVAITHDGRLALSGSTDRTLRLWDLDGGECLRIFEGHTKGVSSAVITPNGRFALSGSYDHTVRLWDLTNGECLRTLEGHKNGVDSVDITPDGRFAIALSGSGTLNHRLRLWNLAGADSYKPAFIVSRPRPVDDELLWQYDMAATMKEIDRCLQGGESKRVPALLKKLRDMTGNERHPAITEFVHRMGLIGRRISIENCRCLRTLEGHTASVKSVDITSDGRFALSGSGDTTLRLWDLETGECLRTLEGHTDSVNSVAIMPDGRFALSGSGEDMLDYMYGFLRKRDHRDNTLRLWDLTTGKCLRIFEGHADSVNSVAATPDGRFALSGAGYSDTTLLWDVPAGGGSDKTLRLWDLTSGECIRNFNEYRNRVKSIAITPDGRLALTGGGTNVEALRLWDLATGRCLRILEGPTGMGRSVVITPDGRLALSRNDDHTLSLWDLASGDCLSTYKGYVHFAAITSDGRFALAGSYDNAVHLLDLASSERLCTLKGHVNRVESVAVTPDGRFALSGSEDTTLRLWEFDWEYEFPEPADWDKGATPYLETFLTLHTPDGPAGFSRRRKPAWMEDDFRELLTGLSYRGYGWLRSEGIRKQLKKMGAEWQGPPDLYRERGWRRRWKRTIFRG